MSDLSTSLLNDFEPDQPWFRKKRRLLAGAVLLALIVGGGWWFFIRDTGPTAPTVTQQTSAAKNGALVTSLSTNGTAAASLTTKLTFGASAKVTAVNAKLGDKVEAGQVLATIDSTDAARKLESSRANVAAAQKKLSDLTNPTEATLAAARAAMSNGQVALATAQDNLANAVSNADAAVTTAEQAYTTAQNSSQTAWINLMTAQASYCGNLNHLVDVCQMTDIPLSATKVDQLVTEIRTPATASVGTAAQSLINANNSYNTSRNALTTADKNLTTARENRAKLNDPATSMTLLQLRAAVDNANATYLNAKDKYEALLNPTAADIATQLDAVRTAQSSLDSAQTAYDGTTIKAPYAGTITALGVGVGDSVTTQTAAFTITNQDAIRVDLSLTESDVVGIKAGQLGTATFTALSGYTYVLRVTAVNPSPTTTQGVVTYQVQTEILRPEQLQDTALQQSVMELLTSVGTSGPRGTGNFAGRTPGAQGSAPAGTRPAGGTPPASGTPGAGRTPGAGGPGAAGGLQGLLAAPMPTPGMNASVTLVKSLQANLLIVPTSAIKTDGQTKYVVLKNADGSTENRTVTTGGNDSSNTSITSGLVAGDVVVTGTTTTTSGTPATANRTTTTTANQQNGQFPGGFQGPQGGQGGGGSGTGGVR